MKFCLCIIFVLLFSICYSQRIPIDKQEHFAAGVVLGIGGSFITNDVHPIINSIIVASAAGVAKEVYDKTTGLGVYDKKDMYYTFLGGVISGVSTHFIKITIKKRKNRRARNR